MRVRAAALVLALLLVGCGGDGERLPVVSVVLGQGSTAITIRAEVASTGDQRNHGLMGRESLGANEGMLFVFREPVRVGFYMKDTLIPLDIAFIGGGLVREIRSMVPCKVSQCPVTYPQVSYEQALEVVAGTFARAGIVPGTTVAIQGALPAAS